MRIFGGSCADIGPELAYTSGSEDKSISSTAHAAVQYAEGRRAMMKTASALLITLKKLRKLNSSQQTFRTDMSQYQKQYREYQTASKETLSSAQVLLQSGPDEATMAEASKRYQPGSEEISSRLSGEVLGLMADTATAEANVRTLSKSSDEVLKSHHHWGTVFAEKFGCQWTVEAPHPTLLASGSGPQ